MRCLLGQRPAFEAGSRRERRTSNPLVGGAAHADPLGKRRLAVSESRHGSGCSCTRCRGFEVGNDLATKHGAYVSPVRLGDRVAELATVVRELVPAYTPADEVAVQVLCLALARMERSSAALEGTQDAAEMERLRQDERVGKRCSPVRERSWADTAFASAARAGSGAREGGGTACARRACGGEVRHVRVGLVQAAEDPQLFGLDLWPKQRELLAEVEAGPRMHVWALGRRSAKTTSAAVVALWSCLLRPELLARLRPGERGFAVAVATNLRQARLFVQAARSIVERSPLLGGLVESFTEDEITFTNATALAAFPCSSRGGRGWPVFCLVMDEAAHFQTETEGPQVADRVFEALVPSTAQFGDLARIVVSSTPYGSSGLFAELFQRAASGELADAVAQHASTAEANPTISPTFLAQEEARDPESFRSEYLAEFLAGGAAFLDPER